MTVTLLFIYFPFSASLSFSLALFLGGQISFRLLDDSTVLPRTTAFNFLLSISPPFLAPRILKLRTLVWHSRFVSNSRSLDRITFIFTNISSASTNPSHRCASLSPRLPSLFPRTSLSSLSYHVFPYIGAPFDCFPIFSPSPNPLLLPFAAAEGATTFTVIDLYSLALAAFRQ